MSYATACPWAPEFSWEELQCRCQECQNARQWNEAVGFNGTEMQAQFMGHILVLRRDWYGEAMPVASAFRCPAHRIPTAKRLKCERKGLPYIPGAHASGQGLDVGVSGAAFWRLFNAVGAYNKHLQEQGRPLAFTGIGVQQKGPRAGRYLHLDNCAAAPGRPRPHGWSYP